MKHESCGVIDDQIHERIVQVVKDLGAEIVYQRGFGKGTAVAWGIEHLVPAVDYVVITDADFAYPVMSVIA